MKIETKQVYTFNGVEYPSYNQALQASNKAKKEELQKYDADKEAIGFEEYGKKTVARYIKNGFPLYVRVKDKWDDHTILVKSEEDITKAFFKLLKERVEAGFWYEEESDLLSNSIVEKNLEYAAVGFLLDRTDYEYEYVSINSFDETC